MFKGRAHGLLLTHKTMNVCYFEETTKFLTNKND